MLPLCCFHLAPRHFPLISLDTPLDPPPSLEGDRSGWGGSVEKWGRKWLGLGGPLCWFFTPEYTGSFQNIFISPPELSLWFIVAPSKWALTWAGVPTLSPPRVPAFLCHLPDYREGGDYWGGVPLEGPGLFPSILLLQTHAAPGPSLLPGECLGRGLCRGCLHKCLCSLPTPGRQAEAAGFPLRQLPFSLQLERWAGETIRNSVNLGCFQSCRSPRMGYSVGWEGPGLCQVGGAFLAQHTGS